jgi:DNA (cytosine-5)-methyltransferase 1
LEDDEVVTDEHSDISRLDTFYRSGFMDDKPTPLKYGELFAGVGGFGMGMEQAGYEPVFQVEWDKNCLKVLHHHWPTVPKWGDVCDVNGADLPPCDVLIFGSPCQDLSVAGKRAGLQDGEKSSMFFEAVRIIKEMRDATSNVYPRATIWENVPGALSSNRGADFATVLASLADIGANLQEYAVLDSCNFRVPQRRRRIFLISIFDPSAIERCPDPLLPVIKGSRRDFAKGRKARKDATRNVEASVDPNVRWWNGGDLADCLTATSNEQRAPDKARLQVVIESDVYGQGSFGQFIEGQISTIRQAGGDLGGGSETLVIQPTYSFDTQFGSNAAVFEDQSPTLKASQQSPSITMPGLAVRRLTPLECERLMGWPDDHTRWTADGKEQADTNRYKQCGNGVATPVAKWVAEHLRQIL